MNTQEAMAAWKSGVTLDVFRVESEGATQEKLWGEAFDLLELGNFTKKEKHVPSDVVFGDGLTAREKDVVRSIVAVLNNRGWTQTIQSHINAEHSPAITIRKE